jgi:predicted 3-demethylubiquinone-9 3-methyltransferase (glyoxalase superfamily)
MQKVTPFLWFNGDVEQAARFYASVFADAKTISASAMSVTLDIEGQRLIIFNGGPHFELNPALSLFVNCESQGEIDALWDKLTADGGKGGRCGWLVDKFGLSWQLIPPILGELLADPDQDKAQRAREAMMKMNKLDIAALERAASEP